MRISRQRLILLGIFALFFGPVILVILMRSDWWGYQPASLKNLGQLVQPPVHLDLEGSKGIDGKWLILQALDAPCGQDCIDRVTALRQIHRATGRNQERLAIVLLDNTGTDSEMRSRLLSIYPEFEIMDDPGSKISMALAMINSNLPAGNDEPIPVRTYVLDPMRNVILAYRANSNPNDIHKDLKRLLKWSEQEGKR